MRFKKLLRVLAYVLISILIIALAAFAFISRSNIPSYPVPQVEFTAVSTPEAVVRGEALSNMLCSVCHLNKETGRLSGSRMHDAPPEFGVIYAPNITNHSEAGIGGWTDAELMILLRTGLKRDGQYAPPYMAKLPNMADEDISAIIAFLRSDHKLVAADGSTTSPSQPSFLTKLLSRVAWKPFPMPDKPIPMPDTTDALVWGKYLAHNLDCFSCHSADFKTNNYLEPERSPGYFGGGNAMVDHEGNAIISSNLTPHAETGIGNWTEAEFVQAVRHGIVPEGNALRFPMMPYTQLSESEAAAIYRYLITIPAIDLLVVR